jgi:hypothetical protein
MVFCNSSILINHVGIRDRDRVRDRDLDDLLETQLSHSVRRGHILRTGLPMTHGDVCVRFEQACW